MNLGDRDLRASDYTLEIIKHAVPAIFIGLVLDKILKKVQEKYEINEFIMIVMQITILAIILFIIQKYLSAKSYSSAWQSTTPGFFFVAFVFSCQFNLFANIKALGNKF